MSYETLFIKIIIDHYYSYAITHISQSIYPKFKLFLVLLTKSAKGDTLYTSIQYINWSKILMKLIMRLYMISAFHMQLTPTYGDLNNLVPTTMMISWSI